MFYNINYWKSHQSFNKIKFQCALLHFSISAYSINPRRLADIKLYCFNFLQSSLFLFLSLSVQLTLSACITLSSLIRFYLFLIYFRLFKQTIQFLQQINVKMSIQYLVLGFEPMTFEHESPSITTRPPFTISVHLFLLAMPSQDVFLLPTPHPMNREVVYFVLLISIIFSVSLMTVSVCLCLFTTLSVCLSLFNLRILLCLPL